MTETNDTTKSMIVKTYQTSEGSIDVTFTYEGFFDATKVAKLFGKQPRNWLTVKPTIDYIEAIKARTHLKQNQLVKVVVGGSNPGTWLHQRLALPFIRWCNTEFGVWCDLRNNAISPEEILDMMDSFDVPDVEDMYIYVIRERETGNLKIGISKNPYDRLKTLQTGNSSKLEIAAIREAPNRFHDERMLHNKASHYNIHGEWFTSDAIGVIQ